MFAGAWILALVAVGVVASFPSRIGQDSRAYWLAWHEGMYGARALFGGPDAYLYSPAFAAAIWPLAQLPLAAFTVLWDCLAIASWSWLLWPLRPAYRFPLLVAVAAISLVGNIEWLIALSLVAAVSYEVAWAVPLLTKVSLGVGAAWYVFRGEWSRLVRVVAAVAVVVALTAFLPWGDWLRLLLSHGSSGGYVVDLAIPTWARVALALPLLAWGARTERSWVLPVVTVFASPDVWIGTLAILAALPRMRLVARPMTRHSVLAQA